MRTREQIITSMCYTFRHDYGLVKEADPGGYTFPGIAGMTEIERKSLWNTMAQIFDNDIMPEFRELRQLQQGEAVVVPKDREHAEALVRIGMFYLDHQK